MKTVNTTLALAATALLLAGCAKKEEPAPIVEPTPAPVETAPALMEPAPADGMTPTDETTPADATAATENAEDASQSGGDKVAPQ